MSKFCPFCGEELVDSAKFCKNCGKSVEIYSPNQDNPKHSFDIPKIENEHKTAIIISYVLAVLIPLFGVFASEKIPRMPENMESMFWLWRLSSGSFHLF